MFTHECFRPRKKVILYLHFTNSLRSDNIYKLCLWIPQAFMTWHVPKLIYIVPMVKILTSTLCKKSFSHNNIYIWF